MPRVSIIVETFNTPPGSEIGLREVLRALRAQTYPAEETETIVVFEEERAELFEPLARAHPWAKFVPMRDANYFPMKSHGLRFASGPIIAFLDADCLPSADWVRRIVETIEGGADVAVGRTAYPPGKSFAHTFDVFDFGYVRTDAAGEANCFYANNVALRREVILAHGFDPRVGRSGGCHLLSGQLKARGYKFVYDPAQSVVHDFGVNRGLKFALERIRVGYDAVNLCRLDDEGVLAEQKFAGLKVLSPFVICAARVASDFRRVTRRRRELGIAPLAVPYFCAASFVMRGIEVVGGLVTVISPDYFRRRFGW